MIVDAPKQCHRGTACAVLIDLKVEVAFLVFARRADLNSTFSLWTGFLEDCSACAHGFIGFSHRPFAQIHSHSNLNAGCASLPVWTSVIAPPWWIPPGNPE